MSPTYEQNKDYAKRYLAKFDEVRVRIPAGQKVVWQDVAAVAGESVNQYVIRAVEERMNREHQK